MKNPRLVAGYRIRDFSFLHPLLHETLFNELIINVFKKLNDEQK